MAKLSKIEKKRRDPNSTYWKKKALAVWSRLVRQGKVCAICGCIDKILNAHHLLPKERYREFMFLVINGICLCQYCHKYSKFSAHGNPVWFAHWLAEHKPEQYAWVIAHMNGEQSVLTYKEAYDKLYRMEILMTPP